MPIAETAAGLTAIHDGMLMAGFLWALHVIIPAFITVPIAIWSRHRVHWYPWELLAFILPFGIWLALTWLRVAPWLPKGINNFGECFYLGMWIPLAALIRAVVGRQCKAYEGGFAGVLLLLLCGLAAAIYYFTPDLGGSFGC